MSRKTVWIPLLPLAQSDADLEQSLLLEILIDPGGYGACTEDSLQKLRGYGLGVALSDARTALNTAGLQPSTGNFGREPPVWLVANPDPRLSNAAGAALGIALGELLYEGRCPGHRLIASGRFLPAMRSKSAALAPDPYLSDKLRSAFVLGHQAMPLPFLVPARTTDATETERDCADLIVALAALNIQVLAVTSLEDAVAACWRLYRENRVTFDILPALKDGDSYGPSARSD